MPDPPASVQFCAISRSWSPEQSLGQSHVLLSIRLNLLWVINLSPSQSPVCAWIWLCVAAATAFMETAATAISRTAIANPLTTDFISFTNLSYPNRDFRDTAERSGTARFQGGAPIGRQSVLPMGAAGIFRLRCRHNCPAFFRHIWIAKLSLKTLIFHENVFYRNIFIVFYHINTSGKGIAIGDAEFEMYSACL